MRAIRVVLDIPSIDPLLLESALRAISWDFRGTISLEKGDLILLCECITLNNPPPPPGFSISGITIEKHLEKWTDNLITHTIVVLRFSNEIYGKYFKNHDIGLMAGTNLTSKGLVIQVSGGKDGIMTLLNDIKKTVKIRSITSAKGAKGMVTDTITSEEYKVLKTAHSNGWYKTPKQTSLRGLAKELNMSKSSVSNYLKSSENRIISDFIDPK